MENGEGGSNRINFFLRLKKFSLFKRAKKWKGSLSAKIQEKNFIERVI